MLTQFWIDPGNFDVMKKNSETNPRWHQGSAKESEPWMTPDIHFRLNQTMSTIDFKKTVNKG